MAEKRARSSSPEVEIVPDDAEWEGDHNGDNESQHDEIQEIPKSDVGPKSKLKSSKRLLLTNIAYEVKLNELRQVMEEEIGEIDFIQIFESGDGRSKGMGVIMFKSDEDNEKCLKKMQRHVFKGRELVVKEDREGERDKYGEPLFKNSSDASVENYGIDSKVLESLNITGHLTNRLFVANIDYKVDERKLKDVFSLAGHINKIWLHKNDEGKPKGTSIIEMSHPVEAVQAIAMLNNQKLYNRELSIRIDKFTQDESHKRFPLPKPIRLPSGLRSIKPGIDIEGVPLVLSLTLGGGVSDDSYNVGSDSDFGNSYPTDMNGTTNSQFNQLFNAMMGGGGMGNMASGANNNQMLSLMGSLMGGGGGGGNYNQLMSMMGGGMMDPMFMQQMMGSGGGGISGSGLLGAPGGGSGSSKSRMSGGSSNSSGVVVRLYVKNLPSNYKWQDLKDKFREAGDVRYAAVNPSKNDSNSSEGLIEYNNPDAARKAIKLFDNSNFRGRTVSVHY